MAQAINAVGAIMLICGILFLFNIEIMKSVISFLKEGNRLYLVGIARVLIGGLFLAGASRCRLGRVVFVIGVIILTSGLVIFLMKKETLKSFLGKLHDAPHTLLRLCGAFAAALGALVIFST